MLDRVHVIVVQNIPNASFGGVEVSIIHSKYTLFRHIDKNEVNSEGCYYVQRNIILISLYLTM